MRKKMTKKKLSKHLKMRTKTMMTMMMTSSHLLKETLANVKIAVGDLMIKMMLI
jgi:hypothetical protein